MGFFFLRHPASGLIGRHADFTSVRVPSEGSQTDDCRGLGARWQASRDEIKHDGKGDRLNYFHDREVFKSRGVSVK